MTQATSSDIHLLLGSSLLMRELAGQVTALAATDQAVLLVGETGVGKSRAARAIHALSSRASSQFRAVECGVRPESLLREVVGEELRQGDGSVYFEEIAELPGTIQAELLASIDGRAGPRVFASSERDLATEVTELHFNETLYYSLGSMPLYLPPLRARTPEDIAGTARALLSELRHGLPDSPREISERALNVVTRYHWPGNIRELRNALEWSLLHARGESLVDVMHLPAEVLDASDGVWGAHIARTLAEVERHHIERTLRAHGANRTHAARDLGISRATLIKKIRDYDVADRNRMDIAGTPESA